MKFNSLTKTFTAMITVAVLATGCGGSGGGTTAPSGDGGEVKSSSSGGGGKQDFIVYNCGGAEEYHQRVVLKAFQEKYGDRYDVKYETLSAADVISKIEAQGFSKGNGNVNIVIMGDSDVPKGIQAGVFAPLSEYTEELKISEMEEVCQENFEQLDESALQVFIGAENAGIAYMPGTEKGARLDAVVGDDGEITYDELKDYILNDPASPKMGRGRISNSGPGDAWTWGLLQNQGEYGNDSAPEKSIAWAKDLYSNGHISLYDGTAATFKDLTENSVDVIPHTPAWYFRLYALGKAEDTLPDHLKVDSFGLEDSKFAIMTGDNVKITIAGHYYMIPSNLSDEAFDASMEYLQLAITPEINSQSYVSLMTPSYTYSSLTKVEDEDVLAVWNEVVKYYPEKYLVEKDGVKQFGIKPGTPYVFMIKDINLMSLYSNAWRDELESSIR